MLEPQRRKGYIMNGFQKRRLLEGNSCKHLEEPNIGLLLECRTFSLISNFSEEPQIILRLISSFISALL